MTSPEASSGVPGAEEHGEAMVCIADQQKWFLISCLCGCGLGQDSMGFGLESGFAALPRRLRSTQYYFN